MASVRSRLHVRFCTVGATWPTPHVRSAKAGLLATTCHGLSGALRPNNKRREPPTSMCGQPHAASRKANCRCTPLPGAIAGGRSELIRRPTARLHSSSDTAVGRELNQDKLSKPKAFPMAHFCDKPAAKPASVRAFRRLFRPTTVITAPIPISRWNRERSDVHGAGRDAGFRQTTRNFMRESAKTSNQRQAANWAPAVFGPGEVGPANLSRQFAPGLMGSSSAGSAAKQQRQLVERPLLRYIVLFFADREAGRR